MITGFLFQREDGFVYDSVAECCFMAHKPDIQVPRLRKELKTVKGRDGVLSFSDNSYMETTLKLSLLFKNYDNLQYAINAFNGLGGRLHFNYKDGYYNVVEVYSFDIIDAKGIPELDIILTIQPFEHLTKVVHSLPVSSGDKTLFVSGSIPTKPSIRLEGSGACGLSINGEVIRIKNLNGFINIDVDLLQITRGTENEGNNVEGDIRKLKLKAGNNTISLIGSYTKVEFSYTPKNLA